MRSIRLSLIVYFLLLLGGALGAVSLIVYETTRENLDDKQQSMARLLRDKHQAKLDDMLLREARSFPSGVQLQITPRFPHPRWIPKTDLQAQAQAQVPVLQTTLGMLTSATGPNGHLTGLLPGVAGRPPIRDMLHTLHHDFKAADVRLPDPEGHLADHYQINHRSVVVWSSPSLQGKRFSIDPTQFPGKSSVDWRFDNATLEGVPVRLVTIKLRRYTFQFAATQGKGPPGPPGGGRPDMRWVTPFFNSQEIYILAAYDPSKKEGVLGQMERELAQDLARLDETTQAALTSLRQSLWLAGLVTFALTIVGGFVLVRLGLRPLHRVSDAVSKVSTKDFRLPLEDSRLPSELRPIVERLKETLEMLHRTFEREKQAAADISHELRTPLAALMTTLDVALRKPRSAEEYQETLRECRESGQQMYGLVERLLMLARLDAGVDHLRPREVDVAQLAEQCASLVRPLAEARGLRLSVHRDGAASMTADPDKLREVVTNLLHNAIEYNRPEGAIDLDVRRDNGDVRVEVRDTGIGISAEAKRHIFERFYRSDPSRQAEGLHAGLGLAIVKGYVDLMGGTIDVESVQGEGSTFRVSLPAGA